MSYARGSSLFLPGFAHAVPAAALAEAHKSSKGCPSPAMAFSSHGTSERGSSPERPARSTQTARLRELVQLIDDNNCARQQGPNDANDTKCVCARISQVRLASWFSIVQDWTRCARALLHLCLQSTRLAIPCGQASLHSAFAFEPLKPYLDPRSYISFALAYLAGERELRIKVWECYRIEREALLEENVKEENEAEMMRDEQFERSGYLDFLLDGSDSEKKPKAADASIDHSPPGSPSACKRRRTE
eukprot:Skav217038  [mRNA]  locus=scaffold3292:2438:3175:- [translate_table: standard]